MDLLDSVNTSEIQPTKQDMQCAPQLEFNNGSCINLIMLMNMAKSYNKHFPTTPIKLNDNMATTNPTKYKKYLIKQFKTRLSECNDQKCWTKQDFVKKMDNKFKKQLTQETFRPDGPEGKFTWLNNVNIDEVMKQYELKYPEFKYLATVPIDFDLLDYYPLKNINFDTLIKNNKTKIGVVFNLDVHTGRGTHWVSLFADFKNGLCYFSDSYGIKPDRRIKAFMTKIVNYMKNNMGIQNVIEDYNKTQNQTGNNACGMYSTNFIIRMLEGQKFEDIVSHRIPDNEVNAMREVYFMGKGYTY